MVDAGFLVMAGCATVGIKVADIDLDPAKLVHWSRLSARRMDAEFMRLYWYDAILDNRQHPDYVTQKTRMDMFSSTPGVQVRQGSLSERPNPSWSEIRKALGHLGVDPEEFKKHYAVEKKRQEQKGVDTLLVLDMVRLAQLGAYDVLVLVTGDTDLAEAVRVVQDYGKRVVIARPEKSGNARVLFDLADELVVLTADTLKYILQKKVRLPSNGD
jgi:uncharacterized LabA/DUF88 family protein